LVYGRSATRASIVPLLLWGHLFGVVFSNLGGYPPYPTINSGSFARTVANHFSDSFLTRGLFPPFSCGDYFSTSHISVLSKWIVGYCHSLTSIFFLTSGLCHEVSLPTHLSFIHGQGFFLPGCGFFPSIYGYLRGMSSVQSHPFSPAPVRWRTFPRQSVLRRFPYVRMCSPTLMMNSPRLNKGRCTLDPCGFSDFFPPLPFLGS